MTTATADTSAPVSEKRDKDGNLVLNEREVTLKQIIEIAEKEFPGVPPEYVYFPRPDYRYGPDDLPIAQVKPHPWQNLPGGKFQTGVGELVTLAQVIQQAIVIRSNHGFSNIRVMWDQMGFHMYTIKSDAN